MDWTWRQWELRLAATLASLDGELVVSRPGGPLVRVSLVGERLRAEATFLEPPCGKELLVSGWVPSGDGAYSRTVSQVRAGGLATLVMCLYKEHVGLASPDELVVEYDDQLVTPAAG